MPTTRRSRVFGQVDDLSPSSRARRLVEIHRRRGLADRLGPSAKAATSEWNYRRDDEERLICIYTHDWRDRRDLLRVLKELRSMGFAGRLTYKTDADTERGIYGPGAAIYWSPPGRQSFVPTRAGRERGLQ